MTTISIKGITQLTSAQTINLIEDWSSTDGILSETFTYVTLEYADFTDDDAAHSLASFISQAMYVSYLSIANQDMTRPVSVDVIPST